MAPVQQVYIGVDWSVKNQPIIQIIKLSFGLIPFVSCSIVVMILEYGFASMIPGTIIGTRAEGSKKIV